MSPICVSLSYPPIHVVAENERDCCIRAEAVIRKAVDEGKAVSIDSIMCADLEAGQRVAFYLRDLGLELLADRRLGGTQVFLG